MEFMPDLSIGWLNGWILLAIEFLIQGTLLLIFPKDVVSRLFDRSDWNVKQRVFLIAGKVFSLACLILIVLTPLKIDSNFFIIGLIVYVIGLVGLVVAMLNFKDTPLDQPVTKGIYTISRHPQIVALFIIFLGICVAIGSWAALNHAIDVKAVAAFWNPGRGRGMPAALWGALSQLHGTSAALFLLFLS